MAQHPFLENLLNGQTVEWKPLGEVAVIKTGQAVSKQMISDNSGQYPVINSGREPLGFIDTWNTENDPIGITTRGAGVGSITWQEGRYYRGNLNYSVTIKDNLQLSVRYLYHILLEFQHEIHVLCSFSGIPALNASELKKLYIPIPPLSVQTKIVQILDTFTTITAELTAELNMRNRQYQYYREKLLTFDFEAVQSVATASDSRAVAWKILGDVFDIFAGGDVPKEALSETRTDEFNIPILSNGIGAKSLYGWTNQAKIHKPSLTISARGTIGWTSIQNKPFFPIVRLLVLTPKIDVNLKYLYYYMKNIENHYKVNESGIPQLTKPMIKDISIPIPPLSEQARIVAILDKFDTLTQSITEGLPREIELRQKQYEYYREALLSF